MGIVLTVLIFIGLCTLIGKCRAEKYLAQAQEEEVNRRLRAEDKAIQEAKRQERIEEKEAKRQERIEEREDRQSQYQAEFERVSKLLESEDLCESDKVALYKQYKKYARLARIY